jgi:hypothetical protein
MEQHIQMIITNLGGTGAIKADMKAWGTLTDTDHVKG